MTDRDVDSHGNCSKCGGTHYGSYMCPMSPSPQGEDPTPDRGPLVGNTSKPVVTEPQGNAGESPAPIPLTSKEESPIVFNLRQIAASDIARWDIRNYIVAAADEIERLTRERQGWVNTAAEFARNMEYYQGLVDRIGRAIGREAYIADDGSVSQDVLRAKVPEIIERALSERSQSPSETSERRESDPDQIGVSVADPDGVSIALGKDAPWYWISRKCAKNLLSTLLIGVPGLVGEKAAEDVLAERARQQRVEGWTAEHDDQHDCGELAQAAVCYVAQTAVNLPTQLVKDYWPWDWRWWKPKDRRRDLVRAGALILAEIERLDRASSAVKAGACPFVARLGERSPFCVLCNEHLYDHEAAPTKVGVEHCERCGGSGAFDFGGALVLGKNCPDCGGSGLNGTANP